MELECVKTENSEKPLISSLFWGKTQQLILGTVAGDCPRDKTPKRKTMEFT